MTACCELHHEPGCCDPDDCGPCCENCPTCPTLARGRLESCNIAINYWNQQIAIAMRQRELAEASIEALRASHPELWSVRDA